MAALKNRYFALRHGESTAIAQGIIVSDPADGIGGYGLTRLGRDHVRTSAIGAAAQYGLGPDTVIVSSDFKRTMETAAAARETLAAPPVIISERLRERAFGAWEKSSNENYQRVWDDDLKDPSHRNHGGESANDVKERALSAVRSLEKEFSGKNIVLVSHGDVLQILETCFAGTSPAMHRSLAFLKPGELRLLGSILQA